MHGCRRCLEKELLLPSMRLIFELALQGNRTGTIAKILNEKQIPTPAAYHVAENHVYSEQKAWDLQRSHWTSGTVYHVLKNEKYKGTYVGAKFIMPVPCKHRVLRAPLEQQVRIEDSHAAIVTPEEFEQAQKVIMLQHGKHQAGNYTKHQYPLKGKVYCGYCQKLMKYRVLKKLGPSFNCRFSATAADSPCKRIPISEKVLEEIIRNALTAQIKQAEYVLEILHERERNGRFTSMVQNDPLRAKQLSTCERIAAQNGVGTATVKRAEKYAKGVDAAEDAVPGAREEILTGRIKATDAEITALAKTPKAEIPAALAELRKPKQERQPRKAETASSKQTLSEISKSIQGHQRQLTAEEKTSLKASIDNRYQERAVANGSLMMCEVQGAKEDFIRRWNSIFKEYPDVFEDSDCRKIIHDLTEDGIRAPWKIYCIRSAYYIYKSYGAALYREMLSILVDAWGGDSDSFLSGILHGMARFLALYQGEYSRDRLILRLRTVHPKTITRLAQNDTGNVADRHMKQILSIYNGAGRTHSLPCKR